MTNVHVELRWRTSNARHDSTASVEIIDDTVKNILVVGVYVVIAIKVPRLSIGKMIIGM